MILAIFLLMAFLKAEDTLLMNWTYGSSAILNTPSIAKSVEGLGSKSKHWAPSMDFGIYGTLELVTEGLYGGFSWNYIENKYRYTHSIYFLDSISLIYFLSGSDQGYYLRSDIGYSYHTLSGVSGLQTRETLDGVKRSSEIGGQLAAGYRFGIWSVSLHLHLLTIQGEAAVGTNFFIGLLLD